jgi:Enoyl-(Acyl carrier protein) reductase
MHYMGLANHSTYAASKAALRSYPRTWAAEFKDSGIRANTLSPGVVDTPMRRPPPKRVDGGLSRPTGTNTSLALISRHDGLEHSVPFVGAVNVAGTQSAAFQITELVEHEQRVIAGAGVMAVPDAILLLAMGRAHARIHVEHDATGRSSAVHKVDPLAGQVSKSRKVLGCRKPLRLEAAHLARRSRTILSRFAADHPAHRRIMAQALGVVHVLVSGKATKYRLPEQPSQCVSTILASACVGQNITRHHRQTDRIIEFAIGKQPSVPARSAGVNRRRGFVQTPAHPRGPGRRAAAAAGSDASR